MADCKKYREMISCYADGELPENDENELLGHLEECASCRSLLSLYKSITGAAEESLVEPPDNFAKNIMEKIRLLPEDEKTNKPTNKPKSLRPVVISFVAAAACLALAFIVSPQLLGLKGMSNTPESMPATMASAETYDLAATQEIMLDGAPDAAAKSAESAGTASDVEDGAGASPEIKYGIMAVTESPQPAPVQPPEFTTGRDVSDDLKNYFAVFVIEGKLPDNLESYSRTENQDGIFHIEITIETANQLIKDGYKVDMGQPEATKALVVFIPAE